MLQLKRQAIVPGRRGVVDAARTAVVGRSPNSQNAFRAAGRSAPVCASGSGFATGSGSGSGSGCGSGSGNGDDDASARLPPDAAPVESPAQAYVDAGSPIAALANSLQCDICFMVPSFSILACNAGVCALTLCSTCFTKLSSSSRQRRCPTCRAQLPVTPNRNLTAEHSRDAVLGQLGQSVNPVGSEAYQSELDDCNLVESRRYPGISIRAR